MEMMLYMSVAVIVAGIVAFLSVTYGTKLLEEHAGRNAADKVLILRNTINNTYAIRSDFSGLTTASFISSHQAPAYLLLPDGSGMAIPEIKASIIIADERPSIPGIQKPAFSIFVRDLLPPDCAIVAARLGSSFSDVIVNESSVKTTDGFQPDLAAAACSSIRSGNVIKLISERADQWVPCRNYGTQYEEGLCPVGQTGVITYSREYSCSANNGYEPGSLGPRTEVKRCCRLVGAAESEVQSECFRNSRE